MNTANLTEEYINSHPSIKDSLKRGLINYSALTRKIIDDLKLDKNNFDAILIACRRYYSKLKKEKDDEKLFESLKQIKVEVKNRIIAAEIKSTDKLDFNYNLIKTNKSIIITSDDNLKKLKAIKVKNNLVEILIKIPEENSQVYSFLCSLFQENNINIIASSYSEDILFVIEEKDIGKAMGLLKFS